MSEMNYMVNASLYPEWYSVFWMKAEPGAITMYWWCRFCYSTGLMTKIFHSIVLHQQHFNRAQHVVTPTAMLMVKLRKTQQLLKWGLSKFWQIVTSWKAENYSWWLCSCFILDFFLFVMKWKIFSPIFSFGIAKEALLVLPLCF